MGEQDKLIERLKSVRVGSAKWTNALNRLLDAARTEGRGEGLGDAQIKHMVSRFLTWKLPENFSPDGGISFNPTINEGTPYAHTFTPSGTNVFDARQAEAMVRHMIEGVAGSSNQVGAAEAEVGRYVYRRIEALMDAKPGTVEAAELTYLSEIAERVEEYGEEACAGNTLASFLSPIREPEIGREAVETHLRRMTDLFSGAVATADLRKLFDAERDAILNLAPVGGRGEEGSSSADLSPASRSPDQHSDGGEG